ncbi:centrosomal protein of 126 kDa isoform X2 [Archocentrus centrarchus]|uniref:centrosomal protein of 126 kDa isoform X2 n=1 Tax=Archocentrus centrarchus TaxID=63155 RepID=UPI0011EA1658|nr:centrosomal protein of 126 kDa isoform X2 [Archocentrus centrarchus]
MQDNFSYYSYSRLRDDGSVEKERQLLVEEQTLCRARARKFSLETNRRRKALDERRKQWDVQEQRLRERILQQRRLQVQDATERFQRAHLPPPQRHRQSFKRNVPNIEDALRQIQDTLSLYTQQSSLLSSSTNVSSCTPSPKPPTASQSSHRQALSAVEAYTKLLQEQSRAEKQHDHSPQGSYLSDSRVSESLSSKDSLENEDPTRSTKTLQCSYSSFLLGAENAHQDPRKQDDLCRQTSELTSVSAVMLLGDNLAQAHKWHEANQEKLEDFDRSNNKMHVSKASWGFTSAEQKLKTEIPSTLHNCNVSALSGNPEPFEVKTPPSNSGNIIIANIAALGNGALNSSCPKQEESMDPTQERIHDDRHLKYPTTEIPLPAKNSNSRDVLFGVPPRQNIFSTTTDNLPKGALQQTGKESSSLSSHKELSASINNLNKVSNLESNTKKPINTESVAHTCLSNIESATHKCHECPEKEVIEASHSVCEVRFIKGILKKQSKYSDAVCVYSSGRLIFAKQVALAIRDSVELARRKTRDLGGNNTVKKKLRWFDEVHVEKEEEKQNAVKLMKGKSSNPCQPKNSSDDHQPRLSALSGTPKNGPSVTPATSAGYHFTKEAWADVHVSLPQQQADEVKAQRSSTRASGPKVPRRERPGRAGPVSSRTRKGTVMRPQSATEVGRIAKTQGKLMVPRPPPRVESVEEKTPCVTKTPYGRDHARAINKQAVAVEQVLRRNSSAKTHNAMTTESTVLDTPLIPSYTCPFSEGDTVSMPSLGHQETDHCRRRRGTAHNEKDLCLDCTPTEEEISQLWHSVRSALTTKDAKAIIKGPTVESGQVLRKACIEQSRQTPGSGNRRLLQTSQLLKPFPSTHNSAFPDEDFESAADVHAKGRLEERDIVGAMETVQTQRHGTVQQCGRQQGLTTISLEEKNILLCLDRLNHQLQCMQEHAGGNTGVHGLVLSDATYAGEVKASAHNKHHASSANNRSRYQKRS